MDGHDNDTNGGANSSDSAQGGIFSTPDLTVNAENVAQPTQSGDERKRVASIFANTDTGRQAQRLNDAMEAQTAPATEDVVIRNGSKKSKMPVIVGIILVVAVAVVTLLLTLIFATSENEGDTPATIQEAFERYTSLLKDGPESVQNSSLGSDWFLFGLDTADLTKSDRSAYLASLQESFTDYEDFVSSSNNADLKEQLPDYSTNLNLIINTLNLDILSGNVLSQFVSGGSNVAYKYIETVAKKDDESLQGFNYSTNMLINQFLADYLSMIEIYSQNGCLYGEDIDYSCVVEIGDNNTTLTNLQQSQDNTQRLLDSNLPILESQLRSGTNVLSSLMGQK